MTGELIENIRRLDRSPRDPEPPDWSVPSWGLFVADSSVGGPARVVEVVQDGEVLLFRFNV